ncbi:WD40 repeat-like protein, partial [Rhizoctonia solani]
MSTLNSSDSQVKDKFGAIVADTQETNYMVPNAEHLSRDRSKGWVHFTAFRKLLERGTHSVSPLKAIVTELADGFNIVEGFLKGNKEFEVLKGELEKTFEMLSQHYGEDGCPAISATVEKLCRDIGQELQDVRIKLGRDQLDRFREASKDLDDVLRSYNRIRDLLQRVSLNVNMSLWKLVDASATDNRLNRIQPAMSAHYNSAQAIELKRGPCAEGTRVDVLNQMLTWVISSKPGSIYWMSGMAGTGKTTIAYSLCEELASQRWLAASFFCSRVLPECRDINRVIPSIAYQLARSSHPFRCVLSGVLEKDPDVYTRLPSIQFDALVVQPLLNIQHTLPGNLVVVLDALDECENKDVTHRVLDIILKDSENLPIKFVVCSRPEPEIRDNMTKRNDRHISRVVLHELDKQAVRADIETYLRSALAQICPSDDQITKLAERAGSLFIYAATAVRYIGYDNFQRNSSVRFADFLGHLNNTIKDEEEKYTEIDDLYTTVLKTAMNDPGLTRMDIEDIQQVLHTIICLREPLTTTALSKLLGMDDIRRVHAALRPLWSVVHVFGTNEIVTTLHVSFTDYILNPLRSRQYYFDPNLHHQTLALKCFSYFRSMRPQFNICELESSFVPDHRVPGLEERINRVITAETFYAAQHWTVHFHSAVMSHELVDELEEFLSVRLLLWMEIMNLKRCAGAMPQAIHLVEERHQEYSEHLKELIHDCWRFTTTFASSLVSLITPHIYISMLPLWPKSSPITRHYIKRTRRLVKVSGTSNDHQDALIATWRIWGVSGNTSATFSPDGSRIAVAVGNNILVFDKSTNRHLLLLRGHESLVESIQFSNDGARIVSGSLDKTIRVWSAQSGEIALEPLEGHTDGINSIALSPDGSRIASGSSDHTICIWSTYTGERLFGPLVGNNERVSTIKYSPNGRYIFSAGSAPDIVIWSQNGKLLRKIRVRTEGLGHTPIDISPDSTRIASGSSHRIHIWNIETGQLILDWSFDLYNLYDCQDISFSPNGTWLASGFRGGNICIWDAHSGDLVLGPLKEHKDHTTSIKFSPDSSCIISQPTGDFIIRLYDARNKQSSSKPHLGYQREVTSIAVSPDGTRIAHVLGESDICIWDVQNESSIYVSKSWFTKNQWPESMYDKDTDGPVRVESAVFTPDGTRVIADTTEGPFVFNSETGVLCNLYIDNTPSHTFVFILAAFGIVALAITLAEPPLASHSTHGTTTASLMLAAHVLLTHTYHFVMEGLKLDFIGSCGSTNPFKALVFQAVLIVTVGIRFLGDTVFGPIDIHSPHINCAEYSPDGTRIVSGSKDGVIRVHDARSNRLIITISLPTIGTEDQKLTISHVWFSSDGRRIISKSYRTTQIKLPDWPEDPALTAAVDVRLRVHCVESGRLLMESDEIFFNDRLVLSPDGTRILKSGRSSTPGGSGYLLMDLDSKQEIRLDDNLARPLVFDSLPVFTRDGSHIAHFASVALEASDSNICIWSAQDGKVVLGPIKRYGDRHFSSPMRTPSLAFFPDGKYLVSGSKDGVLRIIDVRPESSMVGPVVLLMHNTLTTMTPIPLTRPQMVHPNSWTGEWTRTGGLGIVNPGYSCGFRPDFTVR